ncbi:hypothetical protein APTSU1_000514900 [Apodemus speciosus]|uniref:Uncharacterized protein n=1 Tax=Apodemus speciosus TaxID=105296 RepID=A0ABQ0ESC5_APOSI
MYRKQMEQLVQCMNWSRAGSDVVSGTGQRLSSQPWPRCPFQSTVDLEVGGRNGGARIHMW